ncbi:MAG: substrate-binding domain-containing protein [Oscillospiraceae bacterium]|nr:substrate-binding domain-containing protein [Oscillospiraceae bacterium]
MKKKALKALFYIYLVIGAFFMWYTLTEWGYSGKKTFFYENFYEAQSFLLYAYLVVVVIFFITRFDFIKLPKPLKSKIRYTACYAVTGAIIITSCAFSAISSYRQQEMWRTERLEVISQDIGLNSYMPFGENTKAVSLNEKSALQFTNDDQLPRLDGATAFYPVYSAFARAVYPTAHYTPYIYLTDLSSGGATVLCTTTPTAYERLINGETDIIFTFGASKEHLKSAEEKGVKLNFTPIGKEAFVFFVNSENSVNSLTSEEIRQIYSGQITNWSEFGGFDKEIRAYQREVNSGSQTAFIDFMGDTPIIEPATDELFHEMFGIINETAYRNHDHAIGYSFRFFATEMADNDKITLLEIDGISPTRENIENGTYPLIFNFYAVTAGSENPNVELFIDWIQSEQGRYLIEKTGYTAY